MALVVGGIKIDPQGQSLAVNITIPSTGQSVVAYTATTDTVPWPRTASGSAASFPVTISTPTTFYVTAATDYLVSAKVGSQEVAGGLGHTKTVAVDGQVVTLDPAITNFPDEGVADGGTFVPYIANPNAVYLSAPKYGAKLDGTNDDAALTAAAADVPWGGVLMLPAALIGFTTWTPPTNKPISIIGPGYSSSGNLAFGNAGWAPTNYGTRFGGCVLVDLGTQGLSYGGINRNGHKLKGFMVLGPGSGTSVGLTVGATAGAGVSGIEFDVMVSNYATGIVLNFAEECTGVLRARGCSTGHVFMNATNNNHFAQVETQFSTVDAMLVGLPAPGAPTVTPTGTPGTTHYFYKIVAHTPYGDMIGAEGSTLTGNAVLDGTNYSALSWAAASRTTLYDVYRGTASGAENTLVAANVAATTYNDQGGGSAVSPPSSTTGAAWGNKIDTPLVQNCSGNGIHLAGNTQGNIIDTPWYENNGGGFVAYLVDATCGKLNIHRGGQGFDNCNVSIQAPNQRVNDWLAPTGTVTLGAGTFNCLIDNAVISSLTDSGTNNVSTYWNNSGNSGTPQVKATSGNIFIVSAAGEVDVIPGGTNPLRVRTLPAFAASDKYVVADASGNLHKSALGPAS